MFINVDIVPGTANRKLARLASKIFVQFESTKDKFGSGKFEIFACGCPLRSDFDSPNAGNILNDLSLDREKKTLLITGASSGAHNINMAMKHLVDKLSKFKDCWQIVHLCGKGKAGDLQQSYEKGGIKACVLEYCDDMPQLLTACDLVIGRCGAVSVAEFIATCTPAVCLPYPYHADQHQRLNAMEMEKLGAAVIATDHKDDYCKTSEELWLALNPLLSDAGKINSMTVALRNTDRNNASKFISDRIIELL